MPYIYFFPLTYIIQTISKSYLFKKYSVLFPDFFAVTMFLVESFRRVGSPESPLSLPYQLRKKRTQEIIELPYHSQTTIDNYSATPKPYRSKPKKPKYPRKWALYTLARQNEKQQALHLLREAISILAPKTYGNRRGRKPYPIRDKIFLCVQKVMRNLTYDAHHEHIELAQLKGHISCKPRPHSVSDFMNDPQLTRLLENMITITSTPLASLDVKFSQKCK